MINRIASLLPLTALTIALVGCAGSPEAPLASDPTPVPPSVEAPALEGTPVNGSCDSLFASYLFAGFPHDWTLDPSFEPESDSRAVIAEEIGGIACGFTGSAGEDLVVTFAMPTPETQQTLIDQVSLTSEPTEELRAEVAAFFTEGHVEVFHDESWATFTSSAMTQPSDAIHLANIINQITPKY